MSIALELTVNDGATPALDNLLPANMTRIQAAMGPALVRLYRKHFLDNGTNKKGWPTTNFWARAAKATTWVPSVNGVTIVCNQVGVRQRYYGGPISPVRARLLTIPLTATAYGKTAREFSGLFFVQTKSGNKFLCRRGTSDGAAKARLEFLYLLREGVRQDPDPTVLPSWNEVWPVIRASVGAAITRRAGTV